MIKSLVKDWTKFELVWLLGFIAIVIICNIISKDNLINGLIAILGVINVVLIAKGKRSNFYFGFIKIAIYSIICLMSGYYGNFIINFLWFLPLQYVGYRQWNMNVEPRKMNAMESVAISLLTILFIMLTTIILAAIGGNSPFLDALSAICSMLAMLLMCLGYREHWYLWVIVNVTSVVLWSVAFINVGSGLTIAIMYVLYLCNAIYGAINWQQKIKRKDIIKEIYYR